MIITTWLGEHQYTKEVSNKKIEMQIKKLFELGYNTRVAEEKITKIFLFKKFYFYRYIVFLQINASKEIDVFGETYYEFQIMNLGILMSAEETFFYLTGIINGIELHIDILENLEKTRDNCMGMRQEIACR